MSRSVQSRKAISIASVVFSCCLFAIAQNPQLEEKVMALKQNQELNKQKLAQYTWQETETISIKGSVKDTKVYQVRMVNGAAENGNQQSAGATRRPRRTPERTCHCKEERGIPGVWSAGWHAGEAVHHAEPPVIDAG